MKAWMKAGAVLCLAGMAPGVVGADTDTLPLGQSAGSTGLSGGGQAQAFDKAFHHTDEWFSNGLPFVLGADSTGLTSFVRIVNRSAQAGTVWINGTDDSGAFFPPMALEIGAEATVNLNSGDLERGNASKGFPSGIGDGVGNWRLGFGTELDIQPLAYIRTGDGFVTAMHDVAIEEGLGEHFVEFFNPGSNTRQVSRLWMAGTGSGTAQVTITGHDDAGDASGTVRLTLPGRTARTLTAQQLEAGGEGFDGSLGDGAGKWRLSVTSSRKIRVMNLLSTPTGHLANLSTAPSLRCGFWGGIGATREAAEQAALRNCRSVASACEIPVGEGSGQRFSQCNDAGGLFGSLAAIGWPRAGSYCSWYGGRSWNNESSDVVMTHAVNHCVTATNLVNIPDKAARCPASAMIFTRCGAMALGQQR